MFLFLLACGGTFDARESLASCSSVTTDSRGTTTTEIHDTFGWPTLITVDDGANAPVETLVEYGRVAGDVREARYTTGEVVVLETYDGRGNIRDIVSNLFGFEDTICTNTYASEVIATSECNDISTTYDPCGSALEVATPFYAEAFTNTYVRCQPQGATVEGVDADGSYSRTVQYDSEGRYVGETRGGDGSTSSILTTWTCADL